MNPSPYLDIILNSALVASIVPLGSEAGLYAMKSFGTFDMQQAVVLATIGGTLGMLFNYYLGNIMYRLAKSSAKGMNEKVYSRMQHCFNRYGVFVLLFCWVTIGNVVVLLAGYLRTPLKIALPLIVVGLAAKYSFDLL
ncbi:MAG: VTT domain-containing protein [Alphaproteobacteria bacterium]